MSTNFWDETVLEYSKAKEGFYRSEKDIPRRKLCSGLDLAKLGSKTILDAGCGTGEDVHYFHKFGASVYGVDCSEKMISLAIKKLPKLKSQFSVQDLEATNFQNNFFDIIYSRYAMHCSDNLERLFNEFSRILKPKGMLLILVAHPLLGFLSKKTKDYYKKEAYKLKIFDKKFSAISPSHNFSEYLNEKILRKFELLDFYESEETVQSRENKLPWVVPDFLILKFRKR
ncbi:class I SAM-dependent methyltransferase [Patescibacteria group bacterium]|nr:class I SAM-dependent methyltransferase [Patescibacteria group bacterium]